MESSRAYLKGRLKDGRKAVTWLVAAGALIILPSLGLGCYYLIPSDTQMLFRLAEDGKVVESISLFEKLLNRDDSELRQKASFVPAAMTHHAVWAEAPVRARLFSKLLSLARRHPKDEKLAHDLVEAMGRLDESGGAADYFRAENRNMSPEVLANWVAGLPEKLWAENRPVDALEVIAIGWDLAPGRFVQPERLATAARLAGRPEAALPRLRDYVVKKGRADASQLYLDLASEANMQGDALAETWATTLRKTGPNDYPRVVSMLLALGPGKFGEQTSGLITKALEEPTLPVESGRSLIKLCLSRTLLKEANLLVDKLLAQGSQETVFLREASQCRLWNNRPHEALDLLRRIYLRTGMDEDYDPAIKLAKTLEVSDAIIEIYDRRGPESLPVADLKFYMDALTRSGDYERALAVGIKAKTRRRPPETFVLENVARIHRALGQPEASAKVYGELIDAEPANPLWRERRFTLLIVLRRYAEALAEAERDYRETKNEEALSRAIRTAETLRDGESLRRLALQGREIATTASPALLQETCSILLRLGEKDARFDILETLCARFPERKDLAMETVQEQYARGLYADVEDRFANFPGLDSVWRNRIVRIGAQVGSGARDAAIALAKSSLAEHPEWLNFREFAETMEYVVMGCRSEEIAEIILPRLVEESEQDRLTYRLMAARILIFLDRSKEAIGLLGELENNLAPPMRVDYANALIAAGNYAEGEKQMVRAITDTPEPDPKLYATLGDMRHAAGDYERARDAYREALRLLPPLKDEK